MRVRDVMNDDVSACAPGDSLNRAVQIMWERDCGFVPVVEGGRLVGVLTDRDACMGAYTRGAPLTDIRVRDVMTAATHTTSPEEDLGAAQERMGRHKVRRLPVVDGGRLVGVVSINDVARAAVSRRQAPTALQVGRTLAAISEHRAEALAVCKDGASTANPAE